MLISQRSGSPDHFTIQKIVLLRCALEEYRIQNTNYPDRLDLLVLPKTEHYGFMDQWGRPFQYHKTARCQYDLYSLGRDGLDDTGDEIDKRK